jgi:hypothetical protein
MDDPRVTITNSPHPKRTDGAVKEGSDLEGTRKQTIRDYMRSQTDGSHTSYGNRTKNEFPIDGSIITDTEISNGTRQDTGIPESLRPVSGPQEAFSKTVEDGALLIFDSISSGAFFNSNQTSAIAAEADLNEANIKNSQTFGHGAGSADRYQSISSQVSNVLLANRWSTTSNAFTIPPDPVNGSSQDGTYFQPNPVEVDDLSPNRKYQKLGAEAVMAASGYTAPQGGGPVTVGPKANANWSKIFNTFKIENIPGTAMPGAGTNINSSGGSGAQHTKDAEILRTGTARISSISTNPNPSWLEPGRGVDIGIDYINHAGEKSDEFGKEQHFSFAVMNNMIDKFVAEELFGSDQYTRTLAFMAAIYIDNILTAALFDVLLLAEFATFNPQGKNLRDQYDQAPGTQLSKGKARGNQVPIADFGGPKMGLTADLFDLVGLPNPADMFSGAALVEFVLNFMGVNKPIQSKTNLIIGGLQIGDVISFVPSYTIGSLQTTISALKDPLASGFFFNLARQIARKGALQNSNLPPRSEGGAFAFIRFFMDLRENASFKFFVTMTNLGDNAIGQFFKGPAMHQSNGLELLVKTKTSTYGPLTSPAAAGATPSLFMIPKSYQNYREAVGKNATEFGSGWNSGISNTDGDQDQFYLMADAGARIPASEADKVEALLEADYMPFYIKDMRTNEIIGFHAFLQSLSDGFSATYGETRGLGRIEPAYSYESTTRSIGVTFTMMAFSPKDMDMLYWKLNKLVTLVYPQFSKGTQLETLNADQQKTNFYMPFSQIPTASPMVRLRIGDVLTSNHTDSAAARMLGVGQFDADGPDQKAPPEKPGFALALPGGSGDSKATKLPGGLSKIWANSMVPKESIKKMLGPLILCNAMESKGLVVGDIVKIGFAQTGAVSIASVGPGHSGRIKIPATPFTAAVVKKNGGPNVPKTLFFPQSNTWKIIGFETGDVYPKDTMEAGVAPGDVIASDIKVWVTAEVHDLTPTGFEAWSNCKKSYAYITEMISEKLCFSIETSQISEVVSTVAVLSPASEKFITNNTIAKAFSYNRGSGIAGFIDNLQIDWQLNNIQWGTEPGRRAPQGCIITLGFKPIHDITPGIDADGLNRAPVYKVGSPAMHLNEPDAVSAGQQKLVEDNG